MKANHIEVHPKLCSVDLVTPIKDKFNLVVKADEYIEHVSMSTTETLFADVEYLKKDFNVDKVISK